jgi:general stress protein 26
MAEPAGADDAVLKAKVLAILEDNRVMAIATVRPDGWPQVTLVGYVHEDLTLYFVIARDSQKFANIERDPRISLAIGRDAPNRLLGLSMAARASLVDDFREIDRLNALVHRRYPEQAVFAPRAGFAAIMRAAPSVISLIDLSKAPGEPELLEVRGDTVVRRIDHGPAKRSD